jgi:acetyl esterase/lipase
MMGLGYGWFPEERIRGELHAGSLNAPTAPRRPKSIQLQSRHGNPAMNRLITFSVFAVMACGLGLWVYRIKGPPPDNTAQCAVQLRGIVEINAALEDGYEVDQSRRCITKRSHEAVARSKKERAEQLAARREVATKHAQNLAEARKDFKTAISVPATGNPPLPKPPAGLFVRSDYDGAQGRMAAFVTPDPRDGQKHAAVIWLTGGDTNSLDDFWSPQPESNDQTARPFRDAGLLMMFPTLRGGNANPGGKEYFLGEVEDVLAAAEHLARLPYVDPDRIYLGGHSTGGTLALLVAESSGRFRSVFALGPVARVDDYPASIVPRNMAAQGAEEARLRSPIHWLAGITTPTYVIEGTTAPSNAESLQEICRRSTNAEVLCIRVAGANHFSVVSRVAKVIAARLAVPKEGVKWIIRPEDFQ